MKNIINEKPSKNLNGRLLACANFVNNNDINKKNILDIGCGFGWCELNFLSRGAREITATEKSEDDLKTVKNNVDNQKVKLIVCDATNLPFINDKFDTVVMWDVIEHIAKKTESKMFFEVHRVLKSGGHFYISTPYASFFSKLTDPAWWLTGHRHYSKEDINKFAKNHGFEIIEIKLGGGWWSVFSTINMYISKWVFQRKPFFEKIFNNKENSEYKRNNGFVNIFVKFKKK